LASLESKYSSSQVSLGSSLLRDSAHMPTDSSPALKLLSSSSVLLKYDDSQDLQEGISNTGSHA
jgi:hypothetical protein